MAVCPAARHRSAICWISSYRNSIAVDLEIGNIAGGFRYRDCVVRAVGNHIAVLRPVHECVAFRCSRRQRDRCAVAVCAAARYCTAFRRVGRDRDLVAGQLEVRNIGGGFSHRDCVVRAVGNNLTILCPVHECVALVRCGTQRDR